MATHYQLSGLGNHTNTQFMMGFNPTSGLGGRHVPERNGSEVNWVASEPLVYVHTKALCQAGPLFGLLRTEIWNRSLRQIHSLIPYIYTCEVMLWKCAAWKDMMVRPRGAPGDRPQWRLPLMSKWSSYMYCNMNNTGLIRRDRYKTVFFFIHRVSNRYYATVMF
jgi:hypothetical protein